MRTFTCPDSTTFVLDQIAAVDPVIHNGHTSETKQQYLFMVHFVGGGTAYFPTSEDGHVIFDEFGRACGREYWDCTRVKKVRAELLHEMAL